MGLLELQLPVNPELLEQHLADAPDAVALIVLTARLFNDRLGIDARELHGDGWVRASSPMRISPTLAAQLRQRRSTSWPSRPGIGVLIVP